MLVKALEDCFIANCRRRKGSIFSYDGPEAKFLEPVTAEAEGAPAPSAEAEPDTFVIAGKVARRPRTIHEQVNL